MWESFLFGLLLLILGLPVVAVLAVELRLIPPPHASIVLRIRRGEIQVIKGRLPTVAKEQINEIVETEGLLRGFVAVLPNGRIVCSRQIHPSVRQRLRNILVNRFVE